MIQGIAQTSLLTGSGNRQTRGIALCILGLADQRGDDAGNAMLLDVTFFALYRERAGCNRCQLEVSDGGTVADLTDAVRLRFPNLAPPDVKIVVAVNTEYADPEQTLHPGDDVCLIPPVSGGSRHD